MYGICFQQLQFVAFLIDAYTVSERFDTGFWKQLKTNSSAV